MYIPCFIPQLVMLLIELTLQVLVSRPQEPSMHLLTSIKINAIEIHNSIETFERKRI